MVNFDTESSQIFDLGGRISRRRGLMPETEVPQPKPPAPRRSWLGADLLAGIGLGTLAGLLVGLSASPVVASVVAAVLALLGSFFGLGGTLGAAIGTVGVARMAGFGFAMALAFAGGIALRAHGTLGPSFAERLARVSQPGVSAEMAQALAIYDQFGLRSGPLAAAGEAGKPLASAPYAFGSDQGGADPNCASLNSRQMTRPQDRLEAMVQSPEPWASFGRIGQALPEQMRESFVTAAIAERCGAQR